MVAGLITAVPEKHKEFLRNLVWVHEQVCLAFLFKVFLKFGAPLEVAYSLYFAVRKCLEFQWKFG